MPDSIGLEMDRVIPADIERVFEAWTDPTVLRRWFAAPGMEVSEVAIDLSVGGGYRISLSAPGSAVRTIRGEYRSIDRPCLLAFTWQWEGEGPDSGEVTEVTLRFSSHDDGTRVELRHELFASEPARSQHSEGWEGCMDRLYQLASVPDDEAAT